MTIWFRLRLDQKARVLCDFIAGMTDRYAVEFYGRSPSENPQTIFTPL
jgi:dGTPase